MDAFTEEGLPLFHGGVRALVDGKEIHPEDIALDAIRWEGDKSRGSDQLGPQRKATLLLVLDGNDVRSFGRKLNDAYEDLLREDEDFFERPHMDDVPRPLSADMFSKEPLSMKRYLAADSFWRRKAGEALVAIANPFRDGQARWFLEGFRGVRVENGALVLELTARGY